VRSLPLLLVVLLVCGLLVACQGKTALVSPTQAQGPALLPTAMDMLIPTANSSSVLPSSTAFPSPTDSLVPVSWQNLPVVPTEISQRVREVYRHGQELGNNPNAFSNVGDCDATPT